MGYYTSIIFIGAFKKNDPQNKNNKNWTEEAQINTEVDAVSEINNLSNENDPIKEVSLKHKDWIIEIEGRGGDQEDLWRRRYLNGKYEEIVPSWPEYISAMKLKFDHRQKRIKNNKTWDNTKKRLSELICTIHKTYDGILSEREIEILTKLINLKSINSIAKSYSITALFVTEIITKAIEKIAKYKYTVKKKRKTYHIADEQIFVITEKNYAIRQKLLLPIEELCDGLNVTHAITTRLHLINVETLADLVILSDYDLQSIGISKNKLAYALQNKGLTLGMDLTPYGLASNTKITMDNEKFKQDFLSTPEKTIIRQKLLTKIYDYGLSIRTYNCLRSADINTIADLVSYDRKKLMKFHKFGRKCLNEIDLLVERLGFSFGMDVSKYGIVPPRKII